MRAVARAQANIERARVEAQAVFGEGWRDITEAQRDALTRIAYRTGGGGLVKFEDLLSAARVSQWRVAAAELRDSDMCRDMDPDCELIESKLLRGTE